MNYRLSFGLKLPESVKYFAKCLTNLNKISYYKDCLYHRDKNQYAKHEPKPELLSKAVFKFFSTRVSCPIISKALKSLKTYSEQP